ncbi:hypothetical protein EBR77_01605 [bacterium]|nr:hypothetical protein [bacterium]NBX78497.1 hypothetical protein [bacterium]
MKKRCLLLILLFQISLSDAMFTRVCTAAAQKGAIPLIAVGLVYAREDIRHRFFSTHTAYEMMIDGDISKQDAQAVVHECERKASLYSDLDQQTTNAVRVGAREYTFEDEKYTDLYTPLYTACTQLLYSGLWYKRECTFQEKEDLRLILCAGGYLHEQAQKIVSDIRVGRDIPRWAGWYEAAIDKIYLPESTLHALQNKSSRAVWVLYHEVQHYQYSLGHDVRCIMKDTHFEESRAEIQTMYRFAHAHGVQALREMSTQGTINKGYLSGSYHVRTIIADQIQNELNRS